MRLNKLSINDSKTSYMLTSKSFRNTEKKFIPLSFQICLNNALLSQKTRVKYLGVVIDSNFNWSSHVHVQWYNWCTIGEN